MLRKLAFFLLLTLIFALPLWALAQQSTPPPPTFDPARVNATPTQPFAVFTATPSINMTLEYGVSITDMIENGATNTYTFTGKAGDIVSLQLTSALYDLQLRLQDSSQHSLSTAVQVTSSTGEYLSTIVAQLQT